MRLWIWPKSLLHGLALTVQLILYAQISVGLFSNCRRIWILVIVIVWRLSVFVVGVSKKICPYVMPVQVVPSVFRALRNYLVKIGLL